ncbi:WD repeat-containing protein 87 [Globomyces sp. JEL0801]|nr:WD repeat-containing protein 87 [Globomyces sp. JEL0801]
MISNSPESSNPPSRIQSAATTSSSRSRVSSIPESDDNLIQKWSVIKHSLLRSLGVKQNNSDDIHEESYENKVTSISSSNSQVPITLSHGFQPLRSMQHRQNIKAVFVSVDKEMIHLWKSGTKIQKIRIIEPGSKSKATKVKCIDGVYKFVKWIYIEAKHIHVVANQQLEIKILDLHFETLSTFSNPKPVLWYRFCGIDNVAWNMLHPQDVLKIIKSTHFHLEIHVLKEVLEIKEGLEEEWITCVYYDPHRRKIYAGCGVNLFVFAGQTGERVDNYYDIHELSITCIAFYDASEYLITGAKDGTIKIWNARKSRLFDFHDHFNSITGLLLMESICEAQKGTLPLLVSSSLDGTIRMWNFETGHLLYRIDTIVACLGIMMVKKDHFYHYTENTIQLWNVNRYQHTFTMLRSRPLIIQRVEHISKPSKILSGISDGSIRLLSPVTGEIIATGFPTHKDFTILQLCYDMENEIIYCFTSVHSLIIYDTTINPFKIVKVIENSKTGIHKETITTISGADLYNYRRGFQPDVDARILFKNEFVIKYILFEGTESGQIHYLSSNFNDQICLVQAHTTKVENIYFDHHQGVLISCGSDSMFKVWSLSIRISYKSGVSQLILDLICLNSLSLEAHGQKPLTMAVSSISNELAINYNGALMIANYLTNEKKIPQVQEKHDTGTMINIVANNNGQLWAATYADKSVKVWDSKNNLIREIQFNQNLSSISFANDRGDLLVGLSNQISLVKIQDYLPPGILKQMATMDFPDDSIEVAKVFDQTVEFFDFEEKSVDDDSKNKQEQKKEKNDSESLVKIIQLSKVKKEKEEERVKKEVEEREKFRFSTNQNQLVKECWMIEPDTSIQHVEPIFPSIAPLAFVDYESKEKQIIPEVATETEKPAVPEEEKKKKFLKKIVNAFADVSKKPVESEDDDEDELPELVTEFKQDQLSKRQSIRPSVLSLRRPTATPEEPKPSLKGAYLVGVQMPNSVALPQILPEYHGGSKLKKTEKIFRLNKTQRLQEIYGDRETPSTSLEDLNNNNRRFRAKKAKDDDLPTMSLEEMKKFKGDTEPTKLVVPVVAIIEPPEPSSGLLVPNTQKRRPSFMPQKPLHFQLDLPAVPSIADSKDNEQTSSIENLEAENQKPKKHHRKKKHHKKTVVIDEKHKEPRKFKSVVQPPRPEVNVEPVKATVPYPATKMGDEATKKLLKLHGIDEQKPLLTTTEASRVSTIDKLLSKRNVPTVAIEDLTKPKTIDERTLEALNKIKKKALGTMTNTTDKRLPSTTIAPIKIPTVIEKPVATKEQVIDLNHKSNDIRRELPSGKVVVTNLADPIVKFLALPRLQESMEKQKPLTVNKMSKIAANVIRNGNQAEVLQASKAIVALHKMFQFDLSADEVFDTFVAPFVDKYQSDDAVIRKEVVISLGELGVKHDNVLSLLICALNDHDKTIAECAINGLAQFGIADKEALTRAMIELGIIRGKTEKSSSHLLHKQLRLDAAKTQVEAWLTLTNGAKYNLTRVNSYYEHLAGQFYPPDAHDFDAKERAKILASDAAGNHHIGYYWNETRKFTKDLLMERNVEDGSVIEQWTTNSNGAKRLLNSGSSHRRPKTSPTVLKTRSPARPQTSAKLALSRTRVMTAGPFRGMKQVLDKRDVMSSLKKRGQSAYQRRSVQSGSATGSMVSSFLPDRSMTHSWTS